MTLRNAVFFSPSSQQSQIILSFWHVFAQCWELLGTWLFYTGCVRRILRQKWFETLASVWPNPCCLFCLFYSGVHTRHGDLSYPTQPGISALSFCHVSHHCWLQLIWLSQNYFCIAFMRAHRMGSVPIATLTTHTTQQLTIRTDTLAVIQSKCKPVREIRVMLWSHVTSNHARYC